jgi:hypothetical protein
MPRVIQKVRSDKNGKFTVKLPPGYYGFVLSDNIPSLIPGQHLPTPESSVDRHNSTSSEWSYSAGIFYPMEERPIYVSDRDLKITLVNHQSSFCMDCP